MTGPGRVHPVLPRAALAVLSAVALVSGLSAPPSADAVTGHPASPAATAHRSTQTHPDGKHSRPPVYRDPVSYPGLSKVPRTRAITGPTVTLSRTGTFPHTYVDDAGTAHIVWNEGHGDEADVTVYCRLKRNARGCAVRRELHWDKTYDVGDGPEYNTDDIGPRIVRIGDQLLVLSFRYPTTSLKPGDPAPTSGTVVGWLSADGGTTWTDAAILGRTRIGQLVVAGPDEDPIVVTVGEDPFCEPPESSGQICVSTMRSAGYDDAEGTLNPDGGTDYRPGVVKDGADVVMVMSDSVATDGSRMRVRRWNGTEPATDPANWTMSAPISGGVGDLASGPAGVFLMHESNGYPHKLRLRRLHTRGDGVMAADPARTIAGGALFHRLFEDRSGALHALYTDPSGSRLMLADTQPRGTTFGSAATLMRAPGGATIGQLDLSATADGGGFAVANRTGGVLGPGQIVAAPFGTLTPTGKRGLGDLRGGGNVTCSKIGFGHFDITAEAGCFFKGTGAKKNVVVTRNAVDLHGLEIVPLPGSTLVIDPDKLTIDTVGQARVLLRHGDATIELFRGRIARDLAGLRPGDRIFEFPREMFQANILGFPAASGMPVELTAGGVRIPVDVKLPAAMGGFTGHAVLKGATATGLVLDSLDVSMGPIMLGVASFGAAVHWKQDKSWTGSGWLSVPAGGTFKAKVAFDKGDFVSADFDYEPSPPLLVGPFVYLTSVNGGLSLKPETQVRAGVSLGAPLPIKGAYPIKVDGRATMTFPDHGPARFRIDDDVHLFFVRVAHGHFEFYTDGYAQFHGQTDIDLGPLEGGARTNGFVDATTGQFGADLSGSLKLCISLPVVGKQCAGVQGDSALSSNGFAVCAGFTVHTPVKNVHVTGGLAAKWEDLDPLALANPVLMAIEIVRHITIPCDTEGYKIPPPRAARGIAALRVERAEQAGSSTFAVPRGLPTATLRIPGQGGVPSVRVTGPDGKVLAGPGVRRPNAVQMTMPGSDNAFVLLINPRGGTYTVTPVAGSVPLGTVMLSRGYRAATVHAQLMKPGRHKHPRTRAIDYRITHLGHGQSVQFRERGRFGTRVLGTVHRTGQHRFRFHPKPLRGRKRTVEAVVLRHGLVRKVTVVGHYRGPGRGHPGAVKKLRVKRSGSHLTIRFRPARGASRTVVKVRGSAGSRFVRTLTGKHHVLRLDGFRWDHTIRVIVQAWSPDARAGKVKKVVVRKHKHHHEHHKGKHHKH